MLVVMVGGEGVGKGRYGGLEEIRQDGGGVGNLVKDHLSRRLATWDLVCRLILYQKLTDRFL